MDEQLQHLRPVLLVRRRGQVELNGPHDPRIPPRDQDAARARAHSGQHRVDPERASFVERERNDEADTGAIVDHGVEHLAQHVDVLFERCGSDAIGPPLVDPHVSGRVRRFAHGCTTATRYRAWRLPVPWKRVGPASRYRRQSPARSR